MKKAISIILCLILCVLFTGCKKDGSNADESKISNTDARTALMKVLNNEADFTYKCVVFGDVSTENLKDFHYNTEVNAAIHNHFSPAFYLFADFNTDGVDEMLILDAKLSDYLVLRHDGTNTYGYIVQNINAQDINKDGSFIRVFYRRDSDSKKSYAIKEINTLSFEGENFKITTLAIMDEHADSYKINDKEVSKEKAQEYFDNWQKESEKLAFNEYQ